MIFSREVKPIIRNLWKLKEYNFFGFSWEPYVPGDFSELFYEAVAVIGETLDSITESKAKASGYMCRHALLDPEIVQYILDECLVINMPKHLLPIAAVAVAEMEVYPEEEGCRIITYSAPILANELWKGKKIPEAKFKLMRN